MITFPEYDFWLLDLDGTIITVEEEYAVSTIQSVLEGMGASVGPDIATRIWYGRAGLRNELLREAGVEPDTFWDAFHRIERPEARAAATRLHDDAHVVPELPAPRGVVTHCQRYLTEPIMAKLEIEPWFDTVVCCSDERGWKPDPTPVKDAIDRLDPSGDHGVLVGDSLADVQAAHNADIEAVFIDRGPTSPSVDAEYTVTSLAELAPG